MKYTLAIAALLVAAGSTAFAEEGHVSNAQLAELGLPGMTVMSDAQGEEIRGQGFAYTSSVSASALPGTFTINYASALGHNNSASATGAASELEADILVGNVFGPAFSLQIKASVGSAGFAIASAN